MFWDGTRWVDPRATEHARVERRRSADWVATAIIGVMVLAMVTPFHDASAGKPSSTFDPQAASVIYEESDAQLQFSGAWYGLTNTAYSGGAARASDAAKASVSLRFTGTGVAWIGSAGPNDGRARVYLDGKLVKNVDTEATTFSPGRVLYSVSFRSEQTKTLVIEVAGTKGRPTVVVDAIVVRQVQPTPNPPGDVTPTATPTNPATPAPQPTLDPTAPPPPPTQPPATPAPQPSIDPTAPPPPPPTQPPATPAPTSSTGVSVPASIDATGGSDASVALAAFIASVPNGKTINFKAGGVYRLDAGLRILDRSGLTFEGNGATLRATATTGRPRTSPFLVENSSSITIRDFTLTGNNPDAGTSASLHLDRQDQGGVIVYSGSDILIEQTTISGTWGDCVYLGNNGMSGSPWTDGVVYRDSVCKLNGRMGVALVAARHVTVARVSFDKIAMFPFDIEPDTSAEGATYVTIRDNTVATYGLSPLFTEHFFAASGAAGSTVHDITVTGNRVTDPKGLRVTVGTAVRQNIFVTNNVGTATVAGPFMHFMNVDGVTVTGNQEVVSAGQLAEFIGCTGVTYSGNVTN
jgi:hypothetical protein